MELACPTLAGLRVPWEPSADTSGKGPAEVTGRTRLGVNMRLLP